MDNGKLSVLVKYRNMSLRLLYGYLSRNVSFWLFKILEIQKGRTINFNDILRLCTIVVNIAI